MRDRLILVACWGAALAACGWAARHYEGVGTSMSTAAEAFVEVLSPDQRNAALLPFDDPRRQDWHFIPKAERKGVQIKHMNAVQRERAQALLRACLSEIGYEKAETIRALEAILRELERSRADGPIRDPERYYFTIFGRPGTDSKWGLSVEGHHLSLNFVVDQGVVVASTPAFFGANPAEVKTDFNFGPPKGHRTLAKEEDLAFQLLHALDETQRQVAIINSKAPAELRAAGEPQAPHTPPAGLPASHMTRDQQETLRALLEAYLENMPDELAEVRRREIKQAGFENIHFAWAGADRPGIGHYYRIQGPSFVVELVNTQPDASGNPANHIHSVWRQMGGDFGIPQ